MARLLLEKQAKIILIQKKALEAKWQKIEAQISLSQIKIEHNLSKDRM
jgi:ribosomal protein L30E